MIRVRPLALLTVAVALVISACGDPTNADTMPKVTATPTATQSPFSERVLRTALAIDSSVKIAKQLDLFLGLLSPGSSIDAAAAGKSICSSVPKSEKPISIGDKAADTYLGFRGHSQDQGDLWPKAYVAVDEALAGACSQIAIFGAAGLTNLAPERTSGGILSGLGDRIRTRLHDALTNLPDYSDAQLRRALAERE